MIQKDIIESWENNVCRRDLIQRDYSLYDLVLSIMEETKKKYQIECPAIVVFATDKKQGELLNVSCPI